jgi:hypothetical protein
VGKYLVIHNLARPVEETDDQYFLRQVAFLKAVFALGPAWSASQGVALLETDWSQDAIATHLVSLVESGDFAAVLPVDDRAPVFYGGWLVDDEAFLRLLPTAQSRPCLPQIKHELGPLS